MTQGPQEPQWSKDNPFVDQQAEPDTSQQWSTDNPFVDQAETAAPAGPPEDTGMPLAERLRRKYLYPGATIASALEQVGEEVVGGTAKFAAEAGQPLAPSVPAELLAQRGQKPAPEVPTRPGTELAGEAVAAPFQMIGHGLKEARAEGATLKQKAHGYGTAAAGALGIIGGLHGIKELGGTVADIRAGRPGPSGVGPPPGTIVGPEGKLIEDPNAPTPPPTGPEAVPTSAEVIEDLQRSDAREQAASESFATAKTPEEKRAIVDRLQKQQEATAATQKAARARVEDAKATWKTLTPDQRKSIVTGLATSDYVKPWEELSGEARGTIHETFDRQAEAARGRNLDTSQAPSEGPAAPAVIPTPGVPPSLPPSPPGEAPGVAPSAPPAPSGPTPPFGPTVEPPAAPPKATRARVLPDHADIEAMPYAELLDEQHKMEAKVAELNTAHDQRLVKSAPKSVEHEVSEKYLADLQEEAALRLKRDPTLGKTQGIFGRMDEEFAKEDARLADIQSQIDALHKQRGELLANVQRGEPAPPALEALDRQINELQREHQQIELGETPEEQAARIKKMNEAVDEQERTGKIVPAKAEDIIEQQRTAKADMAELLDMAERGMPPTLDELAQKYGATELNVPKGRTWTLDTKDVREFVRELDRLYGKEVKLESQAYEDGTTRIHMPEEPPAEPGGPPSTREPKEPTTGGPGGAPIASEPLQGKEPEGGRGPSTPPTEEDIGSVFDFLKEYNEELTRQVEGKKYKNMNEAKIAADKALDRVSDAREKLVDVSSEDSFRRAIDEFSEKGEVDLTKFGIPEDLWMEWTKASLEFGSAEKQWREFQRKAGIPEEQIGTSPDDMIVDRTEQMTPELMAEIRGPLDLSETPQDAIDQLIHDTSGPERKINFADAIGKKLDEDVHDPASIDPQTGEQVLIGHKGETVTQEMLDRIADSGIERFKTDDGIAHNPHDVEWIGPETAQRMKSEEAMLPPVQGDIPGISDVPVEQRLPDIEQRVEDFTAIERLLAEGGITPETIELQLEALDKNLDRLDRAMDEGRISEDIYEKQLFEIADMKKRLKDLLGPKEIGKAQLAAAGKPYKFKMPDTVGKDLTKFSPDQIKNTKAGISALLRDENIRKTPEANVLRNEFDRILDYEAAIRRQKEGGFLRLRRDVEEIPRKPWQEYFSKKVVTGAEFKQPINFLKFVRQLYQGTVKSTHALNVADRLFEGATGEKLPGHKQAGKLAESMDGSLAKAESFIMDKPFVPDNLGGTIPTGAKGLADIVTNTAKSDVKGFGELWVARRALDLAATQNKSIGIDIGMAQEAVIDSPQHLHQAVDEGRAYHSGLSLYALIKGLLTPEGRAAFELETAYGPIQRMFGPNEIVSRIAEIVNKTGRSADKILGSQPFQRLKQSELLIRNMVESSLDVTHRIIRAADLNEVALRLTDHAIAKPEVFKGMLRRMGHREHMAAMQDVTARADAVRALYKESGIDISHEHATLMANLLSDQALNIDGGILRVWRNGKIELWEVDSMLADSIKSLSPPEMQLWLKALGLPAMVERIGIALDPAFQVFQFINDQFQGYFNTKHGFTPGVDSFKAWVEIMKNSDVFKEALRAGGVEKSSLRGRTSMDDLLAGPRIKPGDLAFNQIKTGHPFKALKTMTTTMRESTRLAEYMLARGRGYSSVEAAWAARDLLGNYSLQGSWATTRALNHMALFLSPSIAVLDKTIRTIRDDPVRWMVRGSSLAVISYLVHLANDGDDEIKNLAQTPGGKRWWFLRVGDEIMKFRKAYLEGAVFADGMEAALEYAENHDPEAFKLWLTAQKNELMLNMLPVWGVVPAEVWANKSLYSGTPIIPESQQGIDPMFQTGYHSGSAERIVGRAAGISPAIISHVVRSTTGYLGESAVRTVSAAVDWANTGELPPVEDLPLMQRVFAKYPSYSVKPVQDFYKLAEKVDRAAETINYVQNHSPEDVDLVLDRYEKEIPWIEIVNESRQQIADLRRAIQDIDDLKDLGPTSKKLYTDEYLQSIIDITDNVTQARREYERSQ